ncbi:MAG: hypothetical protein M1835_004415 [Candelina submexicana]|nr:MAG: hypothetical protein M1835_004415 [Candelina submexicana]
MDPDVEDKDSGELVPLMLSPSLAGEMHRDEVRNCRARSDGSSDSGESIRVRLSPSLAREIQEAEERNGKDGERGSQASGGTMTIYLDQANPTEGQRAEKIPLESRGLDTSILRKIHTHEVFDRQGKSESAALHVTHINAETNLNDVDGPLAHLIDELVASRKLFVSRNRSYAGIEGLYDVLPHDLIPEPLMQYIVWLLQVQEHNSHCARENQIPHVVSNSLLSDPLLAKLLVEDQMHSRWTQKYRTTLVAERALLKARRTQAELMDDDMEMRIVAKARKALDRMVFAECADEQLEETKNTLTQEQGQPLAEIESLQFLNEGQQAILLSEHFTILELVENIEDCQNAAMTKIDENMNDIDIRLNAMSDLLHFAEARTKRIKTRLNRLDATDVKDYQERMKVRKERLDRAEACEYVGDTCQDILSIQAIAGVALKCSEEIESGLGGPAKADLDLYMSMKGCLIFAEMAERSWNR